MMDKNANKLNAILKVLSAIKGAAGAKKTAVVNSKAGQAAKWVAGRTHSAYDLARAPLGYAGAKPMRKALAAAKPVPQAGTAQGAPLKHLPTLVKSDLKNLTKHELSRLSRHRNVVKNKRSVANIKKLMSKDEAPSLRPGEGFAGRGIKKSLGRYTGGAVGASVATAAGHDVATGIDPAEVDPTLIERWTEVNAPNSGKVSKGGNSPSANPQRGEQRARADRTAAARKALEGLSPAKRAALYAVAGGFSGVAGSRIYGSITGNQSKTRDVLTGGAGAVTGAAIGGISGKKEEKTASESNWDGMYHGYKRQ